MSEGRPLNSLHNLVNLANVSHELQLLNKQIEESENKDERNEQEQDNDNSRSSNTNRKKMKRMACVECRQQKSRCDAYERSPEPCTRCMKKGLKCDLKSNYKRTYKRARMVEIENLFGELKDKLQPGQFNEFLEKVPSLSGRMQSQTVSDQSSQQRKNETNSKKETNFSPLVSEGEPKDMKAWQATSRSNTVTDKISDKNLTRGIPDAGEKGWKFPQKTYETPKDDLKIRGSPLECEDKDLGDVHLSKEQIRNLYVEYVRYYHPFFPVVDIQKGPYKIFRLCPILFWVIMFVALRRFQDDFLKSLLIRLSPMIKNILSDISISPITRYNPTIDEEPVMNACSVYSVQAFLLCTLWPPITSSLSADSSWNTIGVALFQAIRIGLHTSSLSLINLSDRQHNTGQAELLLEQVKTWITCNIVSQKVATAFGFPTFVQLDMRTIILLEERKYHIPTSLRFMVSLAQLEDQISKSLYLGFLSSMKSNDSSEYLSLIKLLSSQMDELLTKAENELRDDDSFFTFQLLTARLHLLSFYFFRLSPMNAFESQHGLISMYNSAVALVLYTSKCEEKDELFVKYLPGVYILNIWQAACIIARLLFLPLKRYLNLNDGQKSYQDAINLTAKASILKHDMAFRSSGIMKNMWHLFKTLYNENRLPNCVLINTRMSASVFFDCLYLLREQVGMIILNSKNDEGPEEVDDNDNAEEILLGDPDIFEEEKINSDKGRKRNSSSIAVNASKPTAFGVGGAEEKARKIIRTIPFDPRPISVSELTYLKPHTYAASKHFNTNNLNGTKQYCDAQDLSKLYEPSDSAIKGTPNFSSTLANHYVTEKMPQNERNNLDHFYNTVMREPMSVPNFSNTESETFPVDNSLLWNDIDTIMNDFGFHIE